MPSLVPIMACRQAIIWTNAGLLSIHRTSGTNFSEHLIEIQKFSFKIMHWKMSSGKWRPFCLSLNVLTDYCYVPLPPVSGLASPHQWYQWCTGTYKKRTTIISLVDQPISSSLGRHNQVLKFGHFKTWFHKSSPMCSINRFLMIPSNL